MKSSKHLLGTLLTLVFITSAFLVSAPVGYAQNDQTWSEPVNLSLSGASSDPLLVIDSQGVKHVIWVDEFDGYKYVKSIDGITWTTPQIVTYPFSPRGDSRPVFVSNSDNSINIFWRDGNNSLYYKRSPSQSLASPIVWGETIKLADFVLDFDTTVDAQGTLHVSYVKIAGEDSNPAGIYYRKLDGAGWSVTKKLYESKYFRSLRLEDSHVRLFVTGNNAGSKAVYVVWDDRPQKRIFLAKSLDGGGNWDEPHQIRGPEDFTGSDIPFNVDISVVNDSVLLLWQVATVGSRCTQYSQWSADGGDQFTEPVKMLGELISCPGWIDFINSNESFSTTLLNIQGDLSMIAWNGSQWSTLQSQVELSVFPNPATFDNVLFGCQSSSFFNDVIYVVGCDKGTGGDVWFRSRPLGSLDAWFPTPSAWSSPVEITSTRQNISSLLSVSDDRNNIHAFWVQAPLFGIGSTDATIQYARWNNGTWTKPASILAGFDGVPSHLSSVINIQGRLFLLWNAGVNGDLYLSWASVERAQAASEWSEPVQVPAPTQLIGSSDILVDDSGKMVIVFSVPLNENRGVYIVQSDDLGKSWSQPLQVFDAVVANWDLTDQPQIGLSGDGRLHLLFTKLALRETDPSVGLYYVQSPDGGITWSQPEAVSEKSVLWSAIIGFNERTVHRLWQENNGLTLDVFDQISYDGGETWEKSVKVFNGSDTSAKVVLTESSDGSMHLAQVHAEDTSMLVEVSNWDSSRWAPQEIKEISLKKKDIQYLTAVGVVPQGQLNIMVSIAYPELTDDLQNEILSFTRSLEISDKNQPPMPFLIATPMIETALTVFPDIQLTPTVLSPLANLTDPPSSSRKNLVGLFLVGGILVLIVIIIWPRKKRDSG